MDLYRRGAADPEIARACGVVKRSIKCWRDRRGLPANRLPGAGRGGPLRPEQLAEILSLLRNRVHPKTIAARMKVSEGCVYYRRKWAGIAPDPNLKPGRKPSLRLQPIRPAFRDELYRRINAAVPRGFADDVRQDLVSDIYVAVLAGDLEPRRVARRYADRHGPLSLDQERGDDGDGFTLASRISDDDALDAFDVALCRGLEARGVAVMM